MPWTAQQGLANLVVCITFIIIMIIIMIIIIIIVCFLLLTKDDFN